MNITKRQRAWFILIIAGLVIIFLAIISGAIIFLFYPLFIGLVLLLIGMLLKWAAEWCIKNIHIFEIKERATVIKKKLKIDRGIDVVKESIETIKNKDTEGEK